MIPEENLVPESLIEKDNLSPDINKDQQDFVKEDDDRLSIDKEDKKTVEIEDYLSSKILDIKTYSENDSLVSDDIDLTDINLDESLYNNINSNIQEKQVVEGTVVGIND